MSAADVGWNTYMEECHLFMAGKYYMTNQPDLIPTEHLPYAVAGAWKDCPCFEGHRCGGTGRIYALPDTVRLLCDCHKSAVNTWYSKLKHSPGCPGYEPSTDLAVWESVVFQVWPDALIEKQVDVTWLTPVYEKTNRRFGPGGFKGDGVGLEALLSALAQALVAGGYTLLEVANASSLEQARP